MRANRAATNAGGAGKARLIAATGFGNVLENFDFTVYSYFAGIIGMVMLKTENPLYSTYISTILFGLGFLARPLGSIVLGAYADRQGRKKALCATLILMGLGSAFIGFAPPYAAIGLLAPALILLGRLLQGFSAGGEAGTASTLLMESAGKNSGAYVGWQFTMQGVSAALGALCAWLLFHFLPQEALLGWGWRVPFVFALLIIPAGLYLRGHIDESYAGSAHENEAEAQDNAHEGAHEAAHPLREIWAGYKRQFALAVILVMPVTLLVYGLMLYMPTYLSLLRIESGAAALAQSSARFMLTALLGLVMAASALGGGLLCDKAASLKHLALIELSLLFCALFAVYALVGTHFYGFLAALFIGIALLGAMMPVQALLVMEAFPPRIRVSGFAVSLSAGSCLFGGTAQAILTWLMIATGQNPLAPFYYIGPMLLLSLAAYALFDEQRPQRG